MQLQCFFAEWNAGTFDWIPASFYQGCKRTRLCILRIDRKSAFCVKSVFYFYRSIADGRDWKKKEYFVF